MFCGFNSKIQQRYDTCVHALQKKSGGVLVHEVFSGQCLSRSEVNSMSLCMLKELEGKTRRLLDVCLRAHESY
jgi:hypothetical protein